jgi:predicted thioesterase
LKYYSFRDSNLASINFETFENGGQTMTEELKAGITHEMERQTTDEMSAQKVFPHVPNVYATAVMVGHFEEVCAEMVLPYLGEGEQTVGIGMQFTHTAATPLGMKVRYNAKLVEVDGRKLTFEVEGFDEVDEIGKATHERFIINADKFNSNMAKKAAKASS